MTLRRIIRRSVLDTPIEPLARALYTAVSPTRAARYDRQLNAVIRRVLRPDSNTVDIGAHRGSVLRELIRRAPRGRHIAVEPLPEHARYLATHFPAASVHQCALSDTAGEATFYHVVTRPTRSGLRQIAYPSPDEQVETIRVPLARLDDLVLPELAISLIKIDVEGAEYGVLMGGTGLIQRHQPVIVFEHGLLAPRYYGVPSEAIYRLLVDTCGLRVSTMERWLAGRPPFDEAGFLREVGELGGYYFIAYP